MINQPIFGGYVITGLLGEGGMGAVYVAENAMLGKKLAVKLLHPQLCHNQQIVQRFIAEARAASAIAHPNIIEVVDAAQLDDGRWYIVLEFLEGESLEEHVRQHGQLGIDAALEILVQACAGLESAHSRPEGAIIHRDLKPENLFVTSRPGVPRFVKVLDFGIAKLNDEILAGGIKTGSHMVMGTPGYMSHEQAKGSANVDHRSDIYAMGVIAYRILTGNLPYAATSIGSLVAAQLTQGPPDPQQLRADLPPGWVHTIRSAMANEPAERPQTVRAFAMALIDATPNGRQIAMSVAPGFIQNAPSGEATVRIKGPNPAGQPSAMPAGGGTVALGQPTTLSSAASVVPPTEAADSAPKRWRLAVGLVALLGLAGIAAGLAMKGDDASHDAPVAAAEGDDVPTPPELAPPVTVDVPVETTPPGASVVIGSASYGPTPTRIRLKPGETVVMRVELEGHEPLTERVTVADQPKPVQLALVAVVEEPVVEEPVATEGKKPRKRRSRRDRKKKPKPTSETPIPKPEPVKKKPKGFDPDAPAG